MTNREAQKLCDHIRIEAQLGSFKIIILEIAKKMIEVGNVTRTVEALYQTADSLAPIAAEEEITG